MKDLRRADQLLWMGLHLADDCASRTWSQLHKLHATFRLLAENSRLLITKRLQRVGSVMFLLFLPKYKGLFIFSQELQDPPHSPSVLVKSRSSQPQRVVQRVLEWWRGCGGYTSQLVSDDIFVFNMNAGSFLTRLRHYIML
jgi:hypothetical protein